MDKISIITVCYNSAKTIQETIESVLSQDYPNLEYIIFDGLSTDGTVNIVKSYGSRISKFVSGKDRGLYDAMNSAIKIATGDVIGILNSDDVYSSDSILSLVMSEFSKRESDCVFGDLVYFRTVDPHKTVRKYSGKDFTPYKIAIGILPPHPTFFVRRSVYDSIGTFDLQFKYAADFDLMARVLYVNRCTYKYIPAVFVKMRLGGISTGSLKRIIEINKEDLLSCKKNGIKTNFLLFHLKYLFKVLSVRSFFGFIGR